MLKDYQFVAVELLTQMVRKEASEVVLFRKFFNRRKVSKKHVRLLLEINWTKFAAVELLNQMANNKSPVHCTLEIVSQKSMLDFCPKLNGKIGYT
jgi:hypothetical protein